MDQTLDLILLVTGWVVYYALHSLLAANTIKNWVESTAPGFFKYYRLLYSVVAVIGLLGMLYWNGSLATEYLIDRQIVVRYTSYVLSATGVIIIRIAFKEYDLKGFLGLRKEETAFKRSGILQRVRHPMYTGTILILIGFFLFTPTLPTLITVVCALGYLVIGIVLEERKLLEQFGPVYKKYKKEVPMLFPRLW